MAILTNMEWTRAIDDVFRTALCLSGEFELGIWTLPYSAAEETKEDLMVLAASEEIDMKEEELIQACRTHLSIVQEIWVAKDIKVGHYAGNIESELLSLQHDTRLHLQNSELGKELIAMVELIDMDIACKDSSGRHAERIFPNLLISYEKITQLAGGESGQWVPAALNNASHIIDEIGLVANKQMRSMQLEKSREEVRVKALPLYEELRSKNYISEDA